MSDKNPVTPEEQQEKKPTWLGYHAQLVGQKMVDAARFLGQVFHTELQQDYRSRLLQFDQSGKLVVETKPSTMTVILNIPGGKLDGLTVQIGDIQFTYPSNNILTDSFSLPSPGLRVIISGGSAGDNIAVVESKLPWNQLNRASSAITVGQGSSPWLTQLTGSNATIGAIRISDGTSNNLVNIGNAPMTTDAQTYYNSIPVGSFQSAYNESTWDRVRNNTQGTLLASAARTSQAVSPQQTNYNARGVIIWLSVTLPSGTGGLSLFLDQYDPITSTSYELELTPSPVTTAVDRAYCIYPGASGSSGFAGVFSLPLGRVWGVRIAVGDSSSYTYSVGYALIN